MKRGLTFIKPLAAVFILGTLHQGGPVSGGDRRESGQRSRRSVGAPRAAGNTSNAAPAETGKKEETAKKEEEAPGEPNVVVSGNVGVVRYSPLFWDRLPLVGEQTSNQTSFSLRPVSGDVQNAVLTSTGLGRVELRLTADGGSSPFIGDDPCRPVPDGGSTLALPVLKPGRDVKVWMRFPCDLVGNAGDTDEGKLLVLVQGKKNLEVPLKVQTPSGSPLLTAFLWGVGVVVPALLGYLLTNLGNIYFERWKAREAGREALQKFIQEERWWMGDFFSVTLKSVMEYTDDAFPGELMNQLRQRNVFESIPAAERENLKEAIRDGRRADVRRILAALFPDWKEQIDPEGGG